MKLFKKLEVQNTRGRWKVDTKSFAQQLPNKCITMIKHKQQKVQSSRANFVSTVSSATLLNYTVKGKNKMTKCNVFSTYNARKQKHL